jgi:hypothetical protein
MFSVASSEAIFALRAPGGILLPNNLEATIQEPDATARRRTTYLWIEVGVVLLACVAPLIVTSIDYIYVARAGWSMPFSYYTLFHLITAAGQIALILFIIWRSNDPFSRFGIKPFHVGRDIFGGIAVLAILYAAHYLLWWGIRACLSRNGYLALMHTRSGPSYELLSGPPHFVLLAAMSMASGFSQELVMRAYLIVRFEELLHSTAVAFLLSSVLFACYHGYEGTAGIIDVAVFGMIQGVIFCLFRRLSPIAFAHALDLFILIGRLPLPSW